MTSDSEQMGLTTRGNTDVSTLRLPTREDLSLVQEAIGPGESLTVDLLPRAKMPTGGGRFFDLGESERPEEMLEGVLVLRHAVRVYWKERFAEGGGGNPPDCASMDNQIGQGDNGQGVGMHECAKCPLAEWGTAVDEKGDEAAGKACRQVTRMYLLRSGDNLPTLLALPPSSYKNALIYTTGLAAKGQRYHQALTRVTLVKDKSRGGIDYSKAVFTKIRDLSPDEQVGMGDYRDNIVPFLNNLSVIDVEATERQQP